jgi:hypothetical protein
MLAPGLCHLERSLQLSGSSFFLDASMTSVPPPPYPRPDPPQPVALALNDCQLFINGDLELSDEITVDPLEPASAPPSLVGRNATLIVNGTLVLRSAILDAQDQGMVIFCRRLVMQAQGNFKSALIEASDPSPSGPPLLIEGAIVCGGGPTVLRLDESQALEVRGLNLSHARVLYDPQYLKALNPAADPQVIAFRRLQ